MNARPNSATIVILRGLAGAAVGGIVSYFVFVWLRQRGVLAHALPGALMGFAASLAAGGKSQVVGIVCAVAAVLLTLFAEWRAAPFFKDPSLVFFLTHLQDLNHVTVKIVMLTIGAACGYWFGQGR